MHVNKNVGKMIKKNKHNLYTLYQKQVKDKDTAVNMFLEHTLAQTQSMFVWEGLPVTIPPVALEKMLQTNGNCFVTEVNGELYALEGATGGEPDPYNRPTLYVVANPALNLNKTYNRFTDGVYMENDTNSNGLLPIIGKYAVLYVDGVISLNLATVLTRIPMLISASDDKTKQSADEFINKITDGEFSVIGENAFFKGVNLQHPPTANSSMLTQLIEVIQYFKACMLNDLGLQSQFNMKRERLNLGEVLQNIDALLPYVDNMLFCRQRAAEKINEKYGLNVTVNLGSSWNLKHENYESLVSDVDTENAPTPVKDDEQQEQDTPTVTESPEVTERPENVTESPEVTDTPTDEEQEQQEQEEPDKQNKDEV